MFANCCNSGNANGLELEPKVRVVYFDIPGGRGDAIRLALRILNRPFEDKRVSFPDWKNEKPHAPGGQLPYIELPNGQMLCQTWACLVYVSQNSTLYNIDFKDTSPENAKKVAQIHQIIRLVESLYGVFMKLYTYTDEERPAHTAEVIEGASKLWTTLEQAVANTQGGSGFIVDNQLTIADIALYTMIGYVKGNFKYDSIELTYRSIARCCAAVRKTPQVADYLALHKLDY